MVACLSMVLGCVVGPAALQVSRVRYNEVIQKTTDEQLLLNLVRLQYREAPSFLEVGSVSAQFTFSESASMLGVLHEGPIVVSPDRLDLGARLGYEERPTVTFTPLRGKDFVNELLSPLKLEVTVLLARSGWNIDRVLRLTVQSMNGLDNASSASGPTPQRAPSFERFVRVSRLFRDLQLRGLLELGYESRETPVSSALPIQAVGVSDVVSAAQAGYHLRTDESGERVVVVGSSSVLVWRIPPGGEGDSIAAEIVDLLGLDPSRSTYDFRAGDGGVWGGAAMDGRRESITIATRSLMGTLFYLSQSVEVPSGHRARGLVTTTRSEDGAEFDWTRVTGSLLRIHSRPARPSQAAVAIKHLGHWFYIDPTDLSSKSTFGLLGQLFALQAGDVESAGPVLTLPVGG